ncbi:Bacterial extracellular solute-binding protein, family 7 [Roseivivax jejudonensis]|uniref:Bacterial extracellular solute-binding protein, family 7 n=1 Tax=Roseivivax jejudonensis TaxID=1529041 RepID=A0A1X6ZX94_9RHOB|nr:TRAP transporter substrate-binding protein [Roseivivax jejudonensis]SLN63764.1 Bacterial extracellular solute-binding protein, family 7 [Roseivivax jejudonensis]
MMTKRFWSALLAAGTLLGATAAQAEDYTFHRWLPDQHPVNARTLMPWFDAVREATEGRVDISYTAASLVPPPRQIDAVASGAVDFALAVHGHTPGRFRASLIGELPFLARDAEPLSVALWRTHAEYFEEANEYAGTKVLAVFAARPGAVWSHSRAFASMEDWDGAKVFCGVRNSCALVERLGAVPVQRPGPQVREMLEKKIVDAAFIDHSSYKDFRLQPFVTNATETPRGIYAATFYVVMNEDKWTALSDADKAAIEELAGESLARTAGANWDDESRIAMEQMAENDVAVVEASGDYLAAMQEAVIAPSEAAYLEEAQTIGVDGAAALSFLRAQIEEEG